MTEFLAFVAAAAVLFAAGLWGIRWLYENAQLVWWPQRARLALRAHPEGRRAPLAITSTPHVVPGTAPHRQIYGSQVNHHSLPGVTHRGKEPS